METLLSCTEIICSSFPRAYKLWEMRVSPLHLSIARNIFLCCLQLKWTKVLLYSMNKTLNFRSTVYLSPWKMTHGVAALTLKLSTTCRLVSYVTRNTQCHQCLRNWFLWSVIMLSLFIWAGLSENQERILKSRTRIGVLGGQIRDEYLLSVSFVCWRNVVCVVTTYLSSRALALRKKIKKDHSFVCRDEGIKEEWGARMWTEATISPFSNYIQLYKEFKSTLSRGHQA